MSNPALDQKRKRPRRKIGGYAACGSHGSPWCHMGGPGAKIGQLAIFETHRQARDACGEPVHRVTIYIEREPSKWLK